MPETVNIDLQPKQYELLQLISDPKGAPILGVGGGRGCGKSSAIDRVCITLMYQFPGIQIGVFMRNAGQIMEFHAEPIKRDFPWLASSIKHTMPASLKIGKSKLSFSFAEDLESVSRRTRSGNLDLAVIDQSEQWSEQEIRELHKSVRSKGGKVAKLVLVFNFRGASIAWHREVFHEHKVGPHDDPKRYFFQRVSPWDNIEWCREALTEDGYTDHDYYAWTDEQRRDYSLARAPYVKLLASGDAAISKADLYGSWDSIEGCYYASSFDLATTMISPGKVQALFKGWSTAWLAQDYGVSHYNTTLFAFRIAMSPSDLALHFGWTVTAPINVTVIYRELILGGTAAGDSARMTADAVARKIVMVTPEFERKQIRSFFLSPEHVTGDPNCVGHQMGAEMRKHGMPSPAKADNERIGGYSLIDKLFRGTKFAGRNPENGETVSDVILISSDCAQLLESIPKLMRDPKNIDDVLKTDRSQAKIEQDLGDTLRYLLKSMLSPRKKTADDEHQEALQAALQSEDKSRAALLHAQNYFRSVATKNKPVASWQQRLALISGKH